MAEGFAPVVAEGAFAKAGLDPEFVAAEEARVTRGYLRLRELPGLGLPITEYPLPEARARWQGPEPARRLDPADAIGPSSRTMPRFARSARAPRSARGRRPARGVLFLDDDPGRAEVFLAENPEAVWVQTAAECIARLEEPWDEVHLDHDLGGEHFVDHGREDCGMEVVRWLCLHDRPHLRTTRFHVHSHNPVAATMMGMQMMINGYTVEVRPFGAPEPSPPPASEPPPGPRCSAAGPTGSAGSSAARTTATRRREPTRPGPTSSRSSTSTSTGRPPSRPTPDGPRARNPSPADPRP